MSVSAQLCDQLKLVGRNTKSSRSHRETSSGYTFTAQDHIHSNKVSSHRQIQYKINVNVFGDDDAPFK